MAYTIYNTQASQRGGHLGNIECVCLVLVKVTERALELFYLCWSQIRQVARYDL